MKDLKFFGLHLNFCHFSFDSTRREKQMNSSNNEHALARELLIFFFR